MNFKVITNSNKKSGISLVVLLITILVALILLTATTFSIIDSSDNATIAAFAEELRTLEDSSKEYFLQNNTLPVVDSTPMTKEDVLALNTSDREKILDEITSNFDNEDTTIFYKLDLEKLNVSTISRGILRDDNPKDIYVISYPSFRIYYIEGIEVKNDKFFSLNPKMTKINAVKVNLAAPNVDTSSLQMLANVTVKKTTEEMTNKMGITITAYISDSNSEKVFVKLNNVQKDLKFINGLNTVKIESENEILDTTEERNNFNSIPAENKFMEVIKTNNGTEVARIKIDLKNYDNSYPTIISETQIKNNSSTNVVYFDVADIPIINNNKILDGVISGVKEVRYDYLEKFDEEKFSITNYYADNVDLNDSYMLGKAKKANISSDGTVRIEVPKEVTKIRTIIVDNVSNYNVYDVNTNSGDFFGYTVNNSTNNSFNFDLKVYSNVNITNGSVSISNDNQNYSSALKFDEVEGNNITSINFDFKNVNIVGNYVYVKIDYTNMTTPKSKILKINLNK